MNRPDLKLIHEWVPTGAHILDLACGDGTLLATLARSKGVTGYGLEIDPEGITACIAKGVNVIEQNLDDGLANFDDGACDLVVMTQALQALRRPDLALDEMLRVAGEAIITFPNFAYWRHRVHLGIRGYMPVSKSLPHAWYDTPNIHLSTFNDFEQLCRDKGLIIVDRAVGIGDHEGHWTSRLWPNLFGEIAIFRVARG
ncbi:methionine biosynthesis protein MetW [Halomonas sp. KAO]|uniref:methionine biosynthesis protein MetW n=1 Tax=unclassified Halomonas TaxID=2609666 RepID=UPI00189C9AB0|nr:MULTISPECIES: methionine biosynthesis protein MetW [unclassified Halomonas]MBF7053450.1 methionine biosynthesis protein MetW [Halomonas sp. KAO]MDT0502159.1 methionine biosynthesis protein MetW [Halomonas sp. PAR7]MDT0513613.1 methionine biosynthesis protein MetW [Halomonas sp. LES1]MDT0593052.1 methionine biosynthesis protein MetW [Halomonas sp. PAR8]